MKWRMVVAACGGRDHHCQPAKGWRFEGKRRLRKWEALARRVRRRENFWRERRWRLPK
ncbi:MAG: hypothetical protein WCI46_15565 [Verrucomicrobiota bacterium]